MNLTELMVTWRERAEKAEAELQLTRAESVEHEHNMNHQARLGAKQSRKLERVQRELERVLAREAEMREALDHCLECTSDPGKYGRFLSATDRDIVRKALSSSAGSGYVRKEDVVPLTEALRGVTMLGGNLADDRLTDRTGPSDARARGLMYCEARRLAIEALAHARAKGFLETSENPSNKP